MQVTPPLRGVLAPHSAPAVNLIGQERQRRRPDLPARFGDPAPPVLAFAFGHEARNLFFAQQRGARLFAYREPGAAPLAVVGVAAFLLALGVGNAALLKRSFVA